MHGIEARTSVVIVNWRGAADTIECLESLLRMRSQNFNVFVVDNASGDGSLDQIEAWVRGEITVDRSAAAWEGQPNDRIRTSFNARRISSADPFVATDCFLTLIQHDENGGFAAANNIGLRHAMANEAVRYFWLLNNDTIADTRALDALQTKMELRPDVGLCGATLIYYHRPGVIQARGGATYRRSTGRGLGLCLGQPADAAVLESEIESALAYVVGASMYLSRQFLETIGLMREVYFLYYEEVDWAFRRRGRFAQAYAADAKVYHKEGGSIGSRAIGRPSDLSLYYLTRNASLFALLNDPLFLPAIMGRLLLDAWRWARLGDADAARITLRAIVDFCRGRWGRQRLPPPRPHPPMGTRP